MIRPPYARLGCLIAASTLCLGACSSKKDAAATSAQTTPIIKKYQPRGGAKKPVVKTPEGTTPLPWDAETPPAKKVAETCTRTSAPTKTHLGITPKQLMTCIEAVLKPTALPAQVKKPFVKDAKGAYTIEGLITLTPSVDADGFITKLDALYLDTFRKDHGFTPELAAQQITLASILPSAGFDPRRGVLLFKSIDKRARQKNATVVTSIWDGVAIESSFLPGNVRYQFEPAK